MTTRKVGAQQSNECEARPAKGFDVWREGERSRTCEHGTLGGQDQPIHDLEVERCSALGSLSVKVSKSHGQPALDTVQRLWYSEEAGDFEGCGHWVAAI